MFTKKDRKIANLTSMVSNRNKLIGDLQERKDYYKRMAIEQRTIIEEKDKVLKQILELTECNAYNNDKTILNKIKELARETQSSN